MYATKVYEYLSCDRLREDLCSYKGASVEVSTMRMFMLELNTEKEGCMSYNNPRGRATCEGCK